MEKKYLIDLEIYNSDIINTAVQDYSEFFNISFAWNTLNVFSDENFSEEEIFNEFMNYVIWLTNG